MFDEENEGRPTRQDDAPNAAKTLHRSFYLTGAIPPTGRMERVVETVSWEDVERVLGLEGAEVAELDRRAIVDAAAREYGDYIDGSCGDARYDCFSRAVEYVIPGMLESLYC